MVVSQHIIIGGAGGTGIQGVTGPQGIQGSTGIQGVQGSPGTTGIQGIQGSTGPQGIQGPAGSSGTGSSPTGVGFAFWSGGNQATIAQQVNLQSGAGIHMTNMPGSFGSPLFGQSGQFGAAGNFQYGNGRFINFFGNSGLLEFQNNNNSSHLGRLAWAATGIQQLNLPNLGSGTSDTVAVLSSAQTLSNKSIDANSNTLANIRDNAVGSGAAIAVSKLQLAATSGYVLQSAAGGIPTWSVAPTGPQGIQGIQGATGVQGIQGPTGAAGAGGGGGGGMTLNSSSGIDLLVSRVQNLSQGTHYSVSDIFSLQTSNPTATVAYAFAIPAGAAVNGKLMVIGGVSGSALNSSSQWDFDASVNSAGTFKWMPSGFTGAILTKSIAESTLLVTKCSVTGATGYVTVQGSGVVNWFGNAFWSIVRN